MTLLSPTLAVSWLDRLLGLTRVSWSDEGTYLQWRYALPAWAWALLIFAALAWAGWSYNRLLGPRAGRIALALLRTAVLLIVAALLAGPMLVLPREQVEPDWLFVLADRSASMTLRDANSGSLTRDEQMREALRLADTLWERWNAPDSQRRVLWLGFDAGTYPLAPPLPGSAPWPTPVGEQTLLRAALEQALQRGAGQPIAGVVLLTDGRTPQTLDAQLLERLRQQAAAVFPVPLGSPTPPVDLAIERVDAPEKAMIHDEAALRVWVGRYPSDASVGDVTVRLVDSQSGRVLDEQTRSVEALTDAVRLSGRSEVAGVRAWRVEVGAAAASELVTDNNARTLAVEFVDAPIRVLYVEGYPRWEYRYLKNLLVREETIRSSVLLVEADREFAQEGDDPIARPPNDREELRPFDVVIVGDVPPSYWSSGQLALLAEHVAQRGAGLLWIGGPRHTPRAYEAPPLGDLLPMRRPGAVTRQVVGFPRGAMVRPTPLAESLNILRLSEEGTWPAELSALYWVQQLGALKPAAEPLALAYAPGEDAQPQPLLVRLRYGAGQSVYLASDEIWRWRMGRGDFYHDRFWVQLIQMLGRARLQSGAAQGGAVLRLSHRRLAQGQTAVVELTLDDAALKQPERARLSLGVFRAQDPQTPVDRVDLVLQGDDESAPQRFAAPWTARQAGVVVLRLLEPALADLNLSQEAQVTAPDDEMLNPAADHAQLANLAQRTGGKVVTPDSLGELASVVPNRARRKPNDLSEPLWRSPLALILVLTLLTAEWIGRKAIRLV